MTDRLQACTNDFKDEELHEIWMQLMAAALLGVIQSAEVEEGKEFEARQHSEACSVIVRTGPNSCHDMMHLIFQLEPHMSARILGFLRRSSHESN